MQCLYQHDTSHWNPVSAGYPRRTHTHCRYNRYRLSHNKWLVSQIADNLADTTHRIKRIDAAIQRIYITPQISVNELSSIASLSKKQFERLFHSFVGINPKEYTRIVRFQKALAQMQHQAGKEINQAQIAYTSGYADQSHFIREFKKFCGYTPMSLLKISNPYSDLFTNPV